MRGALQNFNRIYECLRGIEVQMDCSIARRSDVCKYFRGCNVNPTRVVDHIQVGKRPAIDREGHVATRLLKPRCFRRRVATWPSRSMAGRLPTWMWSTTRVGLTLQPRKYLQTSLRRAMEQSIWTSIPRRHS